MNVKYRSQGTVLALQGGKQQGDEVAELLLPREFVPQYFQMCLEAFPLKVASDEFSKGTSLLEDYV